MLADPYLFTAMTRANQPDMIQLIDEHNDNTDDDDDDEEVQLALAVALSLTALPLLTPLTLATTIINIEQTLTDKPIHYNNLTPVPSSSHVSILGGIYQQNLSPSNHKSIEEQREHEHLLAAAIGSSDEHNDNTDDDDEEEEEVQLALAVALSLAALPLLTPLTLAVTNLSKQQAELYKEDGNLFMREGKFYDAIRFYSKAIELDPTNYIFYSNRSAAYLTLNVGTFVLRDAIRCVELNSSWPKGYSRWGAALQALQRFKDAISTFKVNIFIYYYFIYIRLSFT